VGTGRSGLRVARRQEGRPRPGADAIAYLIPHEEKWRDAELTRYVVSIRRVEELTGLDFFPKLPRPAQDRLESTPAPRAW